MIFKNEKYILNIIKFAPPLFILLVITLILSLLIIEKNRTFQSEKRQLVEHYESQNRQLIKDHVYSVYDYIIREQKSTEQDLKDSLKQALDNAYVIMQTIYENNQDKSEAQIKKLIRDALVNIRFNYGRGYFFIFDNDGFNIMHPILPHLEKTNMINHQDANGTFIIKDMIELLKSQNSVSYEWYWKPLSNNSSKEKKKIGLFRNFTPYNWFIGTGEYVEEFEQEVQEKVLSHIRNIRYGNNGYIFVINYDAIYLSHIRPQFIGQDAITNNDTVGIQKVIEDLIDISKKGEGYYSYIQNLKPGIDEPTHKISFVKGLNNWSWMIGTGYYEDDLEKLIEEKKAEFDNRFSTYISKTISLAVLLAFILLLISIYVSKKLHEKFDKYKQEIEEQIKDNQQQHTIMSQQSKMAAMGEMIGNIAHQWRQPLSTISTTATGIQIQKELDILDDKQLDEGLENIHQATKFLSNTIDDFRNFFSLDKKQTTFDVKKAIEKTLSLISVQFHNKDIVLIENTQSINITTFENEFIQVLINILNNAKDELVKLHEQQRYIFIEAKEEDASIIITIKDNAGGIKEEVLPRIFEPYFTTKHQSQGTGIGLFMSNEIITKNMHGHLEVSNETFTYEKNTYKGAQFTITLKKKAL